MDRPPLWWRFVMIVSVSWAMLVAGAVWSPRPVPTLPEDCKPSWIYC